MTQAEAFDIFLQLIQRKLESGVPAVEQFLLWMCWNVVFSIGLVVVFALRTWPYFLCWLILARCLRSINKYPKQ